jgi:hypothetical protein
MAQPVSHYAWPQPPSYPPSSNSYNPWSRHSPTPQSVAQANHLNGNHSPHINNAASHQVNGQAQMRQTVQSLPHSPRQNGHMSQAPNGYPPSPHRSISSSGIHGQNSTYNNYNRPTPQHLTNGGPPPRAPEHPFTQNYQHMGPHSSQGPPHGPGSPPLPREQHIQGRGPPHGPGSPPLPRDQHLQGRDLGSSQNGVRPQDGRINGGASASPSLRNLLS